MGAAQHLLCTVVRCLAVASRQAEKERRRQERLALESAANKREARGRILRVFAVGAFTALAAAAVVATILAASGKKTSSGPSPSGDKGFLSAAVPAAKITDLTAAARAAGCQLKTFPDFGNNHTTSTVKYETNPPTSGSHYPVPAEDGAYAPGTVPKVTQTVHALEHGRVEFQWSPGLSRQRIGQLKSIFDETDGYHQLLFQNATGMPYQVAATAWTHLLGCSRITSATFDALRAFRKRYSDKGPEVVP